MSTDGSGELTKPRDLTDWLYAYPDGRNVEIEELRSTLRDAFAYIRRLIDDERAVKAEVAALRAENERLLAIALAAEEVGNCGLGGMRVTPRQASAFDALAAARARGGGEAMTDTSEAQRTRIEAQITALKTENARYREALEEIAEAPGCESWLIARAALRGKP